MKTIKFRAWDGKKMYIPESLLNDSVQAGYIDDSGCPKYHNDTLMQFTGLQDKNGKDIYEGDIVDNGRNHGEVFMRLGCWYVELARELGYCNNFEVIGNIHENPELIK